MRKVIFRLVALLALPLVAFAQGGGMEKPGKGKRMDFTQELNLGKEQVKAIRDMRNEMRRKHVELRAKSEVKQIDFEEELQKDKPNQKTLAALVDELTAIHSQIYKEKLEMRVKMMSVLTPDQKKKLSERTGAHMMESEQGMGGPGGGMGAGPGGGGPGSQRMSPMGQPPSE